MKGHRVQTEGCENDKMRLEYRKKMFWDHDEHENAMSWGYSLDYEEEYE
jgi:hypothetical protein